MLGPLLNQSPKEISLPIKYFKCKNLAIFSLFHLERLDATILLETLEYIDTSHSLQINISSFSEVFCPTWKETFQAIWKRFILLFQESRKSVEEELNQANQLSLMKVLKKSPPPLQQAQQAQQQIQQQAEAQQQEQPSITNQKRKKKDDNSEIKEFDFTASYNETLSFLFFIVSIDDLMSSYWLYYLWFILPQRKPTKSNLIDMLEILWGTKQREKCKEHRIVLRPIIKYLEPDDYNEKKFQLTDWRCHCGFTLPFQSMRKELLQMIGTKELYREYLNGERKEAWNELRDFIEGFLRFHEGIRNDPPEPKGSLNKILFNLSKKIQITLLTVKSILPSSKTLPKEEIKDSTLLREMKEDGGGGIPDDSSLTKLYKKTSKYSVRRFHILSEEKKERGQRGLELCREELAIKINYDLEEDEKKQQEVEVKEKEEIEKFDEVKKEEKRIGDMEKSTRKKESEKVDGKTNKLTKEESLPHSMNKNEQQELGQEVEEEEYEEEGEEGEYEDEEYEDEEGEEVEEEEEEEEQIEEIE